MVTLKVTIKNLDEIKQKFKQAPVKMTKALNTAVEKCLIKLESSAKKEAPVNKRSGGGNLRQSIRYSMTGEARGKVEVGADYGVFVHEGTRPHLIRPVIKKALADVRTGSFFGKLVHHPGTKANPFLQRALDSNQSFIDKEFEKAVDSVVK